MMEPWDGLPSPSALEMDGLGSPSHGSANPREDNEFQRRPLLEKDILFTPLLVAA
jgi:hypothetical protein